MSEDYIEIQLMNFQNWENKTIRLLRGVNLLSGDSGIGKSTFCRAIHFVLYGGRKHKNIHNKKSKDKNTSVTFRYKTTDEKFIICRERPSETVTVVDKDDNNTYKGEEAQGWINSRFGTEESWISSSYLAQEKDNFFMTETNAKKKDLLHQITFGDEESIVDPDKLIKIATDSIADFRLKIQEISKKIEVRQLGIDDLEEKYSDLSEYDEIDEDDIENAKIKISDLRDEIRTLDIAISERNRNIEIKKKIKHIKQELEKAKIYESIAELIPQIEEKLKLQEETSSFDKRALVYSAEELYKNKGIYEFLSTKGMTKRESIKDFEARLMKERAEYEEYERVNQMHNEFEMKNKVIEAQNQLLISVYEEELRKYESYVRKNDIFLEKLNNLQALKVKAKKLTPKEINDNDDLTSLFLDKLISEEQKEIEMRNKVIEAENQILTTNYNEELRNYDSYVKQNKIFLEKLRRLEELKIKEQGLTPTKINNNDNYTSIFLEELMVDERNELEKTNREIEIENSNLISIYNHDLKKYESYLRKNERFLENCKKLEELKNLELQTTPQKINDSDDSTSSFLEGLIIEEQRELEKKNRDIEAENTRLTLMYNDENKNYESYIDQKERFLILTKKLEELREKQKENKPNRVCKDDDLSFKFLDEFAAREKREIEEKNRLIEIENNRLTSLYNDELRNYETFVKKNDRFLDKSKRLNELKEKARLTIPQQINEKDNLTSDFLDLLLIEEQNEVESINKSIEAENTILTTLYNEELRKYESFLKKKEKYREKNKQLEELKNKAKRIKLEHIDKGDDLSSRFLDERIEIYKMAHNELICPNCDKGLYYVDSKLIKGNANSEEDRQVTIKKHDAAKKELKRRREYETINDDIQTFREITPPPEVFSPTKPELKDIISREIITARRDFIRSEIKRRREYEELNNNIQSFGELIKPLIVTVPIEPLLIDIIIPDLKKYENELTRRKTFEELTDKIISIGEPFLPNEVMIPVKPKLLNVISIEIMIKRHKDIKVEIKRRREYEETILSIQSFDELVCPKEVLSPTKPTLLLVISLESIMEKHETFKRELTRRREYEETKSLIQSFVELIAPQEVFNPSKPILKDIVNLEMITKRHEPLKRELKNRREYEETNQTIKTFGELIPPQEVLSPSNPILTEFFTFKRLKPITRPDYFTITYPTLSLYDTMSIIDSIKIIGSYHKLEELKDINTDVDIKEVRRAMENRKKQESLLKGYIEIYVEPDDENYEKDLIATKKKIVRIEAKLEFLKYLKVYHKLKKEMDKRIEERIDILGQIEELQYFFEEISSLARESIEDLVESVNDSLQDTCTELFEKPISTRLHTTKELKSGEERANVNLEIIYDGSKFESYSELSGGEKKRVSLALLLALMENNPSPICILDEVLPSMNLSLVKKSIEVIKEKCKDRFVINICHRIPQGIHSNIISLE